MYAYGLTRVKWIHNAAASLIGMFPGTVMYVYLGSLGDLAAQAEEVSAARTVLHPAGLVATAAVTIGIARSARRILRDEARIDARSRLRKFLLSLPPRVPRRRD